MMSTPPRRDGERGLVHLVVGGVGGRDVADHELAKPPIADQHPFGRCSADAEVDQLVLDPQVGGHAPRDVLHGVQPLPFGDIDDVAVHRDTEDLLELGVELDVLGAQELQGGRVIDVELVPCAHGQRVAGGSHRLRRAHRIEGGDQLQIVWFDGVVDRHPVASEGDVDAALVHDHVASQAAGGNALDDLGRGRIEDRDHFQPALAIGHVGGVPGGVQFPGVSRDHPRAARSGPTERRSQGRCRRYAGRWREWPHKGCRHSSAGPRRGGRDRQWSRPG